jgi:hypothetical protein
MEIAVFRDSNIVVGQYKDIFPNTSFGANGPSDEFLTANAAKKVNRFKAYDTLTEKLVSCTPYFDGDFVSVVEVQDLTEEEIQAAKDSAMSKLRATRNMLLAETDWRFRSDMNPSSVWINYCIALRNFPETVEDARLPVEWPTKPE